MVTRNDGQNTLERTTGPQRQVTGQLGQVQRAYNPVRHNVRPDTAKESSGSGFGTTLLKGLAGLMQNYGEVRMQSELERAYIDGQIARRNGKVEEELDSNFLTRPFVRGGWRDYNYQMVQAAEQSKMLAYIHGAGKEKTPEEFASELEKFQQDFHKSIDVQGLTARARAAAIETQMRLEDQLAQEHAKAHSEYSGFRRSQEINAAVQSYMSTLPSNFEVVHAGADISNQYDLFTTLMTEGIADHAPELQGALQLQVLGALYEDGHIELANQLVRDFGMQNSNTRFTLEQQQELGKLQAKAKDAEAFTYQAQATELVVGLDNMVRAGQVIPIEYLRSVMHQLHTTGYEPGIERVKQWFLNAEQPKDSAKMAAAAAYARKDVQTVQSSGFTNDELGDVIMLQYLDHYKDNEEQAYAAMVDLMTVHGHTSPVFSRNAHSSMQALMSTMGNGLPANEQNVKTVQGILDGLKVLDVRQGRTAVTNILKGMEPREQAIMGHVLNQPELPLQQNLADAVAKVASDEQMDMTGKVYQISQAKLSAIQALYEKEYSKGWGRVKALFRMGEASPIRNARIFGEFGDATLWEAQELAKNRVFNSFTAEHLYEQAFANVAGRLVTWHRDESGVFSDTDAVLLPKNFMADLTAEFGGATPNPVYMQEAFKFLAPTPSSNMETIYHTNAMGDIEILQRPKDSQEEPVLYRDAVTVKDVAEAVRRVESLRVGETQAALIGTPVVVVDPTQPNRQTRITLHGNNSVGLPESDVLRFRQLLLHRESFRFNPYQDGKDPDGTQRYSVGFGHRLPRDYKPTGRRSSGFLTEQLESWFIADTERSMQVAKDIATAYGFDDDTKATLAVASMVYQMGPTKVQDFAPTFRQIAAGTDFDGLRARSRGWSWYTGSDGKPGTPNRVEDLLSGVRHRFK